ncbi:MAG: High-affinity branched-chain amino acid transport system permease protein LivH, partial [uncultured Acetobacteraceae bacterium]
ARLPVAERLHFRRAALRRRLGLHPDLRPAADREPEPRGALPARRVCGAGGFGVDRPVRGRCPGGDGRGRAGGARARPGPAALRARLRVAAGAVDGWRGLRAERPRPRRLGRRHLHRADARSPHRRDRGARRFLSDLPPLRPRRRRARLHAALAADPPHAAGCSDTRRGGRRRDGGRDRHRHPPRVPRHVHAGLGAGGAGRRARRGVPVALPRRRRGDPGLLPRRRHHRRARQPPGRGAGGAADRFAEYLRAGVVPRTRLLRRLRADGLAARFPALRPVRPAGV